MREIKFRAWVKEDQTMSFPLSLYDIAVGDHDFSIDPPEEGDKEVVVMQFTGLHDKNGNEVFEGDVVEGNPLGSTGVRRGQVIWMNDGWYVSDETERDLEKRLHEDFFTKVDVIGNIYENPELLK